MRTAPPTLSRRRWLGWIVRLVVFGVFLAWFIPYARHMLTLEPAPAAISAATSRPANDATAALIEAIAAIPQPPTLKAVSPTEIEWIGELRPAGASLEIATVLDGPWDYDARPYLEIVVAFLSAPPMHAALEQVRRLEGRPFELDRDDTSRSALYRVSTLEVQYLVKILASCARIEFEANRDPTAAWATLRCGWWLVEQSRTGSLISLLRANALDGLLAREAVFMARAEQRVPDRAVPLLEYLERTAALPEEWQRLQSRASQPELSAALHSLYSDDPSGNGWVLLDRSPTSLLLRRGVPSAADRSRAWNLFAPLFSRRSAVAARLDALHAARLAAAAQPYALAAATLKRLECRAELSVLDGPAVLLGVYGTDPSLLLHDLSHVVARRAAAIATLGVERFRGQQHRLPESLEQLVPDVLSGIPVDPFCGKPIHYRRTAGDDYVVYDCGVDSTNNGGQTRAQFVGGREDAGYDNVHTLPRRPATEPQAKYIATSQAADERADKVPAP